MTEATPDDLAQAVSSHGKLIVVLAGPNGAGKSTFFEAYLSATGILFDNSSANEPYRLFAVFEGGAQLERCEPLPEWARTVVQD